ncbi:MurR/RpiR family transcriptional regulator [Shimia sediminis]|uniref:MurR/RpiR family transcriptional regulator n=1 Tax=Shimia sediminis TaxID=2497945 RepID=UPI000F8C3472|nr:SIS domain-containing protein [Shimia sediminis]
MIHLDFESLNALEQKIHATLEGKGCADRTIRITEAAELCGCSTSKISKFVKKLGFANFRQYLDFLNGNSVSPPGSSGELERLSNFLNGFDTGMVDKMVRLISACDKLVLLGAGPSFQCAQYVEYRLKTCTNIVTIAAPDDLLVASVIDKNSLLLIFTVTGAFRSFEDIYSATKAKGATVALVLEEYNLSLVQKYDKVFCLTNETQPGDLAAHEKTRTAFFIFMEEVIRELRSQPSRQ